jgi:hypothetical protein
MPDNDPKPAPTKSPTARAEAREAMRARREARRGRQKTYFDLFVSGFSYLEIAEKAQVSVATIRREVARSLAQSAPESAESYVALQLSRLQKALKHVDLAIEDGDIKAISALTALMAKFDQYQGFTGARPHANRRAAALPKAAPAPLALPRPRDPALPNLAPKPLETLDVRNELMAKLRRAALAAETPGKGPKN